MENKAKNKMVDRAIIKANNKRINKIMKIKIQMVDKSKEMTIAYGKKLLENNKKVKEKNKAKIHKNKNKVKQKVKNK